MTEPTVRSSLSTPMTSRRPRISFDSDAVGRYSEAVARFFGTGMYLLIQTVVVIVWIVINVAVVALRFDPYPFILLNLAFSTQAAYAAPLILLAQNRQEDRDKESVKEDRLRATQTKADTEFLARELASVRLSVGETVTRDYLRRELDDLRDSVERIETMLAGLSTGGGNADGGKTDPDDRGRG
ncbi:MULTISPECIES: DUF1003 domain-containing protein [Dietzia]|uniref:DUF1003 domain-containing protein n=1 Tax=Dietzia cinnamea TaxID=321318 RepID=A0A4R3ZVR2_9ACTN|nr:MULTISPECIES: DUF1003 domain-containing protein [Dietzia]KZO58770.1 hypothetical protein A2U19_10245 [Dietzia maris]MBC7308116.1 DUF1003 domain-containing protein [Dietzia sp.]MBM7229365.1 DUF1003 domain-containing protein [Dietzia cinnamea]MCT1640374.1 DUF1003 domain-containing protein [Dietzia cinnamea]MCT1711346.1 DUF1003 domain-containing protein [Dietzia cinnamea]